MDFWVNLLLDLKCVVLKFFSSARKPEKLTLQQFFSLNCRVAPSLILFIVTHQVNVFAIYAVISRYTLVFQPDRPNLSCHQFLEVGPNSFTLSFLVYQIWGELMNNQRCLMVFDWSQTVSKNMAIAERIIFECLAPSLGHFWWNY